jgi:hypothetical protein
MYPTATELLDLWSLTDVSAALEDRYQLILVAVTWDVAHVYLTAVRWRTRLRPLSILLQTTAQ